MPNSAWSELWLAVLIVVLLFAAFLIRRAGASLRAELKRKADTGGALTPEQVAAITSQGLATAEQLFMMSPKEQQLLAITAMATKSKKDPPRAPGA